MILTLLFFRKIFDVKLLLFSKSPNIVFSMDWTISLKKSKLSNQKLTFSNNTGAQLGQGGEKGRPPLPFFEIRKKCPHFEKKKGSDCIHFFHSKCSFKWT